MKFVGSPDFQEIDCAFAVQAHPANARNGDPSHLAHDARNCLTVLRVYCDLLRSSDAIRDGYEPWMNELAGAVERGQALMDLLMDSMTASAKTGKSQAEGQALAGAFDREHRGSFEIEPSPRVATRCVDISAALRRRLPVLQRLAGDRIQVEIHAPADAGTVRLSEIDFERILYNLVGNAIEAMPQGGTLRISLNAGSFTTDTTEIREAVTRQRNLKTVSLSVVDSGTGIEPECLAHIFEKGFSGKDNCELHPEHHGFGLSIVRELAERAGGDVHVSSHPGFGSRFEVQLPAA